MKTLRAWRRHWPLALMAVSGVVIVWSLRLLFGSTDWAGLGQWVGGLGAFAAAVVALNIAQREAQHRAKEQEYADFVRANFITVGVVSGQLIVSNRGSEPIFGVRAVAFHRQLDGRMDSVRMKIQSATQKFLLPMVPPYNAQSECKLTWYPDPISNEPMWTQDKLLEGLGEFEIEYTDLHANTYRRWTSEAQAMTIPIRPGTAARLGLKPPARPMPTGLINTPRHLTDKQMRELHEAANRWFANGGWEYMATPPVTPDWDARFRFGKHPVPVEVYDPVTSEHLGSVLADPSIFQPPRPPRRGWWHRKNR